MAQVELQEGRRIVLGPHRLGIGLEAESIVDLAGPASADLAGQRQPGEGLHLELRGQPSGADRMVWHLVHYSPPPNQKSFGIPQRRGTAIKLASNHSKKSAAAQKRLCTRPETYVSSDRERFTAGLTR